MAQTDSNGKTAMRLTAGLLGALVALQSVFVGLLVSHIQDRGIHNDQQYVTLAAYAADREHFGQSLEEIKFALRDIQKRLEQDKRTYLTCPPGPDALPVTSAQVHLCVGRGKGLDTMTGYSSSGCLDSSLRWNDDHLGLCLSSVTPAQAGVQTITDDGGVLFFETAGHRTGDLLCQ